MNTHEKFGYGRVSTQDQSLEAQKNALVKAGATRVFVEKITGTKSSRPELDLMKSMLRSGDTVLVTRIDRLGRSAKDLLDIVTDFETKGVSLKVLEQNIDTSTSEGKLFFTMVAAFAEFEHSIMVSRTKDGLAAARARGRVGGRKPKLSEAQIRRLASLYASKNVAVQDLARMFGISRPSVYRLVKMFEMSRPGSDQEAMVSNV